MIQAQSRRYHDSGPASRLRAAAGDTLVIGHATASAPARTGEIIEVLGPDGAPPYRVWWIAGEYESLITPGADAHLHKGH